MDNRDSLPGLLGPGMDHHTAIKQMPISNIAKAQLKKVMDQGRQAARRLSASQRESTPFFAFLKKQLGGDDPEVLLILRMIAADDYAMGADVLSVAETLYMGIPIPLNDEQDFSDLSEHYIHHFPDGNASIAQLLVRRLIPRVAPGNSISDIIRARFNYDQLDQPDARVRLRLNSTVVRAQHSAKNSRSGKVNITYINDGKAHQVSARHCVLACYNSIIPHLAPELPASQKRDPSMQMKLPLVYSTVMLKNWRALQKLGIGAAFCPGNRHCNALADFPISLGGRQASPSVDKPLSITMFHIPFADQYGLPPHEPFGNTTVANSDSAAGAYMDAAIEYASRA